MEELGFERQSEELSLLVGEWDVTLDIEGWRRTLWADMENGNKWLRGTESLNRSYGGVQ